MARVVYSNFTGGEVTPTLSSRYDLKKFGSFLQCCENFIPNLHGDVERRPGTAFVADIGEEAVLLPFSFNTDSDNNYVLIFTASGIKIGTATGLISDVNLSNPYALEDVYALSYAQVGDVLYLAHRNYAFRKITRSGAAPYYTWKIQTVALNQSLNAPSTPAVAWHGDSGSYTLRYVVTAVDEDGIESLASPIGSCTGVYPTDWVQGNYVSLSWGAVPGAVEYNVYRESAGYYGFIGVVNASNTGTTSVANGINFGSISGTTVYYSAKITRTIKKDIHSGYEIYGNYDQLSNYPGTVTSDTNSGVVVTADSGQRAYAVSGSGLTKLLVRVERTNILDITNYYTEWDRNNEQAYSTKTKKTASKTDYLWVMVTPADLNNPAGTYRSFDTGSLGSGTDYPRGSIAGYQVSPRYLSSYTFTDQNYEPNTAMTPKIDWNPFAGGNNPATVCFHQQRLCLAGTKDNPASFYMSRTGDYENFRKSSPLQDDDPVEYMLASGSIDDVKWMISFGDLLIGTSGCEYQATSSGAAITSSDVQISAQTYWGSASLNPLVLGQSILHCQRSGHHVRDLYYSWETSGYNGTDLSVLAPQEVENYELKQWCLQQSVGSNIWCARDDGTMLCLTYMKEQNVFAWSRHVTDGKVTSLASISGGDSDVLMMVVKRTINGQAKYYLEKAVDRFGPDTAIINAWYVDCGKSYVLEEKSDILTGLEHLKGHEVVALVNGAPVEGLVVSSEGTVKLPFPATVAVVGLNFKSVLSPLPIETDTQEGTTVGKRRAYGKCTLRLFRSVGGKYAATQQGDLFDISAWKERTQYDIPFLPNMFGTPCAPFSGDIDITLPSGQDTDTSIWLIQDRPMPFRVCAITMNVDFGEN